MGLGLGSRIIFLTINTGDGISEYASCSVPLELLRIQEYYMNISIPLSSSFLSYLF